MKPTMPGWAKMLILADPGKPESCLAILVTGEYNFLAVMIENNVVHNLYSNRGISILLLIYTTWSTVSLLVRMVDTIDFISLLATRSCCGFERDGVNHTPKY